jgi:hypothetical protein
VEGNHFQQILISSIYQVAAMKILSFFDLVVLKIFPMDVLVKL